MKFNVVVVGREGARGTIELKDTDIPVADLKRVIAAKFDVPLHLLSLCVCGVRLGEHRRLNFYQVEEDDTIYGSLKKVRYVLKMPSWMTSTEHDHRTLADAMGIFQQEDEPGENETESYDYRRDSFPFAYQGVYYQIVEPGEHPFRKLADASLPGALVWTEKTEFWRVLRNFLQKHYAHEATEKIVECVKQELRKYTYGINLDTIEFMAKECLKQQPSAAAQQ